MDFEHLLQFEYRRRVFLHLTLVVTQGRSENRKCSHGEDSVSESLNMRIQLNLVTLFWKALLVTIPK